MIARALLCVALAALACCGTCRAEALRYCDQPVAQSATQKDKLLRWAAVIKAELEDSGQRLALIARSGLDLGRFGQRYSHAGVSLKASPNAPWSVRQLYYACDERQPKLFDQGMAGFVLGTSDPSLGFVSIVFVPAAEAEALERVALDNAVALRLLGSTYSANAFAFSTRYQNCNQWVAELLASAWGSIVGGGDERRQAQRWLDDNGYQPTRFAVRSRALMWLGTFVPWLHDDDHPPDDVDQSVYRVSMPASIEAFVRAAVPGAMRIELCHTERHIVIRRGWESIAEGCRPGEHDTVIAWQ